MSVVDSDVSGSSKPRPKAKPEQRKVAAALIAQGASSAEAARSIHVSLRTLERWRATNAFQALVTQAERAIEQARYSADRKTYERHGRAAGAPEPVHPRDKRLGADARPELADPAVQARDEVLARQAGRAAVTDADVIDWILQQPCQDESDFLDKRDAERGRISPRALRRFRGEAQGHRSPPQVRVWGFPSIAEQSGFFSGSGPDTRDIFLVHNPHCYDR